MAAEREMVALLNRDSVEYVEQYKSNVLKIPAGKAIKMSRRDAVQFKGTYSGSVDGDPTRVKIKNLIMLPVSEINPDLIAGELADLAKPAGGTYICNYDGREFTTQEALDAHLEGLKNKTVGKDEMGNIVTAPVVPELSDPDEMVSCQFCGKMGLKGARGLQAHMRICPKLTTSKTANDQAHLENETANAEVVMP